MRVHTGEESFKCSDCESRAGGVTKKRHSVTLEQEMKIVNQHAAGKAVTATARDQCLSQSVISPTIKNKKWVMDTVKASASIYPMIVTKERSGPLEEMEQLQVTWMEDQIQKRMPLSLLTIQTKAHLFFEQLKKNYDDTHNKDFVASRGWFPCSKTHHNFHSVKISGEAASSDAKGAAEFKDALHKIIIDEGYLPDQIFNVDETGLYWKWMPAQFCIHKEAETLLRHTKID
ncbi:tigger transposable element-derived protein 1-like [Macrobrachium rosenbergii]|uniref:tigger transposable element-derived protein 1-like n=1 Tax=Macrobrachium rosenbergii TaxID=79674 RepID=UPI0034D5EF01